MKKQEKKKKLSVRLRHSAVSYAMLLPFFSLFIIFMVIPAVAAMGLSLTGFNMVEIPKFVGLRNYIRLLVEDRVFITVLKNTFFFAIICGPLSYVFAFMMAWVINEMPRPIRVFMTILFYAPSISGNIYFIWTYMFSGDEYGIINSFLMNIGLISEPILWLTDTTYNMAIIILVQIWVSLGVSFLSFIAGLQSIDPTLYEAGIIDGIKNRFQRLWYITLPNMKSMLIFGAILQISGALSVGGITQALTGGINSLNYSTATIINYLEDYATSRYEMGYASAIAVVLFGIVILSKKLIFKILKV